METCAYVTSTPTNVRPRKLSLAAATRRLCARARSRATSCSASTAVTGSFGGRPSCVGRQKVAVPTQTRPSTSPEPGPGQAASHRAAAGRSPASRGARWRWSPPYTARRRSVTSDSPLPARYRCLSPRLRFSAWPCKGRAPLAAQGALNQAKTSTAAIGPANSAARSRASRLAALSGSSSACRNERSQAS